MQMRWRAVSIASSLLTRAWLGRRDRFLDIVQAVTREILRDFAAKHFRQPFVVAFAKLSEGARGSDNDEIRNLAIQHPLVEQIGDTAGETVFRGLAVIRIARTALMACAGPFVYAMSGSGIAVNAGLASSPLLRNRLNFSPSATATVVPLGNSMKSPDYKKNT
jgi:hypothetical protein